LHELRSKNDQSESSEKFDAHRKRVLDAAVIDCIIVDSRSFGDFRKVGMYENPFFPSVLCIELLSIHVFNH
jgi:hypothetical protein